ncbi:MAG: NB-ARC domain-containing protein [Planctomycetota bacterium]|mgnify:CR=1 FL=1
MAASQRSGVFLSYARNDGEGFAAKLRQKLREGAPDIHVKQDRLLLEGGIGFWKQLMDAIDSVEFLILVMTPSAMESEMVRKEWRYARQQGVCVYPVKGAPDSALRFTKLPRWMSKAHFFAIETEWETFVAHLRKGCDTRRVPFMAPDLPDNFIERPDEFGRLKNHLLSPDRKGPVAITTALSGAGGFGKTTLAAALCHDEDIIESFDDGILWVTLGQRPNVMSGLVTLFAALTGDRPGFTSEQDAAFQLGQKLEDLSCLVVIDDVWDAAHLRLFLRGGRGCTRLFTTRDAEIASEVQRVNVDEMREEESVALLTSGLPGLGEPRALELSRRLGEWPLALELARASMRQRIVLGDSSENAAQHLLQALDRKGVSVLKKSTAEPRHQTIDAVVRESLTLVSLEDRKRLTELSIFPENAEVPLRVAGTLWGLEEFDAEEIAQRLARFSLLKLDLQRGTVRLHDVMQTWLAEDTTVNAPELHARLVDGWRDWLRLTDEYAWRWLIWHLAQAGRKAEIERILQDPDWLQAKLDSTDVNSLIADLAYLLPSREADLMQGALRLSAHILARDTRQLWSQLAGRLGREELCVRMLVRPFASPGTSLLPYTRTLTTPGQALLRTLSGHKGYVDGVAVYANGTRAIVRHEARRADRPCSDMLLNR